MQLLQRFDILQIFREKESDESEKIVFKILQIHRKENSAGLCIRSQLNESISLILNKFLN